MVNLNNRSNHVRAVIRLSDCKAMTVEREADCLTVEMRIMYVWFDGEEGPEYGDPDPHGQRSRDPWAVPDGAIDAYMSVKWDGCTNSWVAHIPLDERPPHAAG